LAASLPELDSIDRNQIVNRQGESLKDFRRRLVPRYGRVWLDIGLGYAVLVASALVIALFGVRSPRYSVPLGLAGGLLVGYVVAFLELFFHEAAHYNLSRSRRLNDALANLFLGLLVGQEIKAYRIVHFDHHRFLGTTRDTEHSYFDALDFRFIVEALTGIKVLRVLTQRGKHVGERAEGREGAELRETGHPRFMLVAGLLLNLAVMTSAALAGAYSLALAWPIGVLVIHPAVNAVRQLLEHRSYDARSDIDYAAVDHGAMSRMFGWGPLASTLGGAGFNRHLLHHWDPQLSYTRFAELERFLLETKARDAVLGVTTTYTRAFLRLFRSA
jgi:fatty acid desaturase